MKKVLAADLGGTKTLVRLVEVSSSGGAIRTIFERCYKSGDFGSMEAILVAFTAAADQEGHATRELSACLAVAGPVTEHGTHQSAVITKLPWQLSSADIHKQLGLKRVRLINDFVAIGYGVAATQRDDDVIVYAAEQKAIVGAPRVVLGAGTGLGVCQIFYPDGRSPMVCPSEGGHMDFSPQNDQQYALHRFMRERYDHVSYDRIVCGAGIRDAFLFFAEQAGQSKNDFVERIAASPDPAAAISAAYDRDPFCRAAIGLFFEVYGAMAGNLALLAMPFGGVFLAGGIAPKLRSQLGASQFTKTYLNKGRLSYIVKRISVHLIQDTSIGVNGAAYVAAQLID